MSAQYTTRAHGALTEHVVYPRGSKVSSKNNDRRTTASSAAWAIAVVIALVVISRFDVHLTRFNQHAELNWATLPNWSDTWSSLPNWRWWGRSPLATSSTALADALHTWMHAADTALHHVGSAYHDAGVLAALRASWSHVASGLLAWRPPWLETCVLCIKPPTCYAKRLLGITAHHPIAATIVGALALASLFRWKVVYQSLTPLPGLGIQLSTCRTLQFMHRDMHTSVSTTFVPREDISSVVIHEALKSWNVVYYLGIVLTSSVVVPFDDVRPQLDDLVRIYHAVQEELFAK